MASFENKLVPNDTASPARRAVYKLATTFNPDKWPKDLMTLAGFGNEEIRFLQEYFGDKLHQQGCDLSQDPSPLLMREAEETSYDTYGGDSVLESSMTDSLVGDVSIAEPETPKAPEKKVKNKSKVRNINGYIVFAAECRKGITVENPDLSFGEISQIVGAKWKGLPKEQKDRYGEKAKKIHEDQLAKQAEADKAFIESLTTYPPSVSPGSEHTQSPGCSTSQQQVNSCPQNKSKIRNISGYIVFAAECRKVITVENPDLPGDKKFFGEISKIIGAKWQGLPKEQKDRYGEKAKKIHEDQLAKQAEADKAFIESLTTYPPSASPGPEHTQSLGHSTSQQQGPGSALNMANSNQPILIPGDGGDEDEVSGLAPPSRPLLHTTVPQARTSFIQMTKTTQSRFGMPATFTNVIGSSNFQVISPTGSTVPASISGNAHGIPTISGIQGPNQVTAMFQNLATIPAQNFGVGMAPPGPSLSVPQTVATSGNMQQLTSTANPLPTMVNPIVIAPTDDIEPIIIMPNTDDGDGNGFLDQPFSYQSNAESWRGCSAINIAPINDGDPIPMPVQLVANQSLTAAKNAQPEIIITSFTSDVIIKKSPDSRKAVGVSPKVATKKTKSYTKVVKKSAALAKQSPDLNTSTSDNSKGKKALPSKSPSRILERILPSSESILTNMVMRTREKKPEEPNPEITIVYGTGTRDPLPQPKKKKKSIPNPKLTVNKSKSIPDDGVKKAGSKVVATKSTNPSQAASVPKSGPSNAGLSTTKSQSTVIRRKEPIIVLQSMHLEGATSITVEMEEEESNSSIMNRSVTHGRSNSSQKSRASIPSPFSSVDPSKSFSSLADNIKQRRRNASSPILKQVNESPLRQSPRSTEAGRSKVPQSPLQNKDQTPKKVAAALTLTAPDLHPDFMVPASTFHLPPNVCRVCRSDKAMNAYGGVGCNNCASFFHKCITAWRGYECAKNKMCSNTNGTQDYCAWCRFQKCLAVGLKPELVGTRNKTGAIDVIEEVETDQGILQINKKTANSRSPRVVAAPKQVAPPSKVAVCQSLSADDCPDDVCGICGADSTTKQLLSGHYACSACQTFFRRKGIMEFDACATPCSVTVQDRTCNYCRLQKCFACGMGNARGPSLSVKRKGDALSSAPPPSKRARMLEAIRSRQQGGSWGTVQQRVQKARSLQKDKLERISRTQARTQASIIIPEEPTSGCVRDRLNERLASADHTPNNWSWAYAQQYLQFDLEDMKLDDLRFIVPRLIYLTFGSEFSKIPRKSWPKHLTWSSRASRFDIEKLFKYLKMKLHRNGPMVLEKKDAVSSSPKKLTESATSRNKLNYGNRKSPTHCSVCHKILPRYDNHKNCRKCRKCSYDNQCVRCKLWSNEAWELENKRKIKPGSRESTPSQSSTKGKIAIKKEKDDILSQWETMGITQYLEQTPDMLTHNELLGIIVLMVKAACRTIDDNQDISQEELGARMSWDPSLKPKDWPRHINFVSPHHYTKKGKAPREICDTLFIYLRDKLRGHLEKSLSATSPRKGGKVSRGGTPKSSTRKLSPSPAKSSKPSPSIKSELLDPDALLYIQPYLAVDPGELHLSSLFAGISSMWKFILVNTNSEAECNSRNIWHVQWKPKDWPSPPFCSPYHHSTGSVHHDPGSRHYQREEGLVVFSYLQNRITKMLDKSGSKNTSKSSRPSTSKTAAARTPVKTAVKTPIKNTTKATVEIKTPVKSPGKLKTKGPTKEVEAASSEVELVAPPVSAVVQRRLKLLGRVQQEWQDFTDCFHPDTSLVALMCRIYSVLRQMCYIQESRIEGRDFRDLARDFMGILTSAVDGAEDDGQAKGSKLSSDISQQITELHTFMDVDIKKLDPKLRMVTKVWLHHVATPEEDITTVDEVQIIDIDDLPDLNKTSAADSISLASLPPYHTEFSDDEEVAGPGNTDIGNIISSLGEDVSSKATEGSTHNTGLNIIGSVMRIVDKEALTSEDGDGTCESELLESDLGQLAAMTRTENGKETSQDNDQEMSVSISNLCDDSSKDASQDNNEDMSISITNLCEKSSQEPLKADLIIDSSVSKSPGKTQEVVNSVGKAESENLQTTSPLWGFPTGLSNFGNVTESTESAGNSDHEDASLQEKEKVQENTHENAVSTSSDTDEPCPKSDSASDVANKVCGKRKFDSEMAGDEDEDAGDEDAARPSKVARCDEDLTCEDGGATSQVVDSSTNDNDKTGTSRVDGDESGESEIKEKDANVKNTVNQSEIDKLDEDVLDTNKDIVMDTETCEDITVKSRSTPTMDEDVKIAPIQETEGETSCPGFDELEHIQSQGDDADVEIPEVASMEIPDLCSERLAREGVIAGGSSKNVDNAGEGDELVASIPIEQTMSCEASNEICGEDNRVGEKDLNESTSESEVIKCCSEIRALGEGSMSSASSPLSGPITGSSEAVSREQITDGHSNNTEQCPSQEVSDPNCLEPVVNVSNDEDVVESGGIINDAVIGGLEDISDTENVVSGETTNHGVLGVLEEISDAEDVDNSDIKKQAVDDEIEDISEAENVVNTDTNNTHVDVELEGISDAENVVSSKTTNQTLVDENAVKSETKNMESLDVEDISDNSDIKNQAVIGLEDITETENVDDLDTKNTDVVDELQDTENGEQIDTKNMDVVDGIDDVSDAENVGNSADTNTDVVDGIDDISDAENADAKNQTVVCELEDNFDTENGEKSDNKNLNVLGMLEDISHTENVDDSDSTKNADAVGELEDITDAENIVTSENVDNSDTEKRDVVDEIEDISDAENVVISDTKNTDVPVIDGPEDISDAEYIDNSDAKNQAVVGEIEDISDAENVVISDTKNTDVPVVDGPEDISDAENVVISDTKNTDVPVVDGPEDISDAEDIDNSDAKNQGVVGEIEDISDAENVVISDTKNTDVPVVDGPEDISDAENVDNRDVKNQAVVGEIEDITDAENVVISDTKNTDVPVVDGPEDISDAENVVISDTKNTDVPVVDGPEDISDAENVGNRDTTDVVSEMDDVSGTENGEKSETVVDEIECLADAENVDNSDTKNMDVVEGLEDILDAQNVKKSGSKNQTVVELEDISDTENVDNRDMTNLSVDGGLEDISDTGFSDNELMDVQVNQH